MGRVSARAAAPTTVELDQMHAIYRQGGQERGTAPHIVYRDAACPHDGCEQPLHAIDFRPEDRGRAVRDPLVGAWWDDTGFAGRCPHCNGWFHFTIRGKRALSAEDASGYPQLPDNWPDAATVL